MTAEPVLSPPSFDTMKLSDALRRAIAESGYTSPTLVQAETFELIATGRDVIVQSKTGSGKTAAFAIPLLDRVVTPEKRVQVLALCPTRELAMQVGGEFSRLGKYKGIATAAIYGGASMSKQIEELQAGAQVVAGTPGRVLDHLRRGTLDVSGLRAICLDEADEMLSMGFAEELNAILEFIPKKRQGLLFSATMPEQIQRLARRHLTEPQQVLLSTDNIAPSEVSHYVYFVGIGSRARELARILELENPDGVIIFCNTKDETQVVAAELQRLGLNADWLNSDRAQNDRERVMAAVRAGTTKYLVATDVAARGIDVSNISHVINFGFPESPEQYVHRTGRTGRAGRRGTAISLITPRDVGNLYFVRLTYGIRPVERSLPTAGEERTKREADRLALLREAFPEEPADEALSLARRMLASDDAERLVASLVGEFFSVATKQAIAHGIGPMAAARPVSAPAPAPEPRRSPPDSRRESRPSRESSPRPAPVSRVPPPAPEAAPVVREAPPPPREEPAPAPRFGAPEGAPPPRAPRTRSPRGAREPLPPPARALERPRRIDVPGEGPLDEDGPEIGMDEMRLAIGRRDGIRAGDVARLVREKAQLERRDVGRIMVRDRFTLVSVRAELLDATLEALRDAQLGDRPLVPERGKSLSPSTPPPAPRDDAGRPAEDAVPEIPDANVPSVSNGNGNGELH